MFTKAISGSGLIFTLAIAIRLIYLLSYHDSPQFNLPMVDAEEYHKMATDFSHGNIPEQFAFRPPLYPFLLGIVYMIFGKGFLLSRLIQLVIGAYSCVLIQKIGTRIYGKKLGFVAGVLASLCGLMIYFDLELLPTSTVVLFNLLFIHSMLRAKEHSSSMLWAGLWLAASALTRPVTLTFYPFAILWLWISTRKITNITKFMIGAIVPLVLSLLLHISLGAGPVLISAQGGINFYIGSHPESDGMTAHLPGSGTGWNWDQIRAKAEAVAGQSLTASQIDKHYYRKGLNQITADPFRAIKATWHKARLFWNRTEISNNRDLYYHGDSFPIVGWLMWIGFPLLLPLAITGIFIGIRDNNIQFLTLFITIQFLTIIPFFVNARFRHSLTPLLIVLALGGFRYFAMLIKAKSGFKRNYSGIIGFGGGVLLLFAADSGIDTKRNDYGLFTDGMLYERMGKLELARDYYLGALERNPRSIFVNFQLGEMARKNGDMELAASYYRSEITNQPSYAKAWNNLGVTLMELDETDRALECYEQAFELRPDLRETANNIAKIWGMKALEAAEEDYWNQSRQFIAKSLSYDPDNPVYKTLEIEARLHLKDSVGIENELESIIRLNPSLMPAIELLNELREAK